MQRFGIPEIAPTWFNHELSGYVEKDATQIFWERSITTDRPIGANQPDIIVVDRRNKMAILIDISIPGDWNVATKEHEKLTKYR